MICPFCLFEIKPLEQKAPLGEDVFYVCPRKCSPLELPILLVVDHQKCYYVTQAMVGLPGHGKTTYLAATKNILEELLDEWQEFSYEWRSEEDRHVFEDVLESFKDGQLPVPNVLAVQRPILLKLSGYPYVDNPINLFSYDVGGEAFEQGKKLVAFADFVRRSKTLVWCLSLNDVPNYHDLLNTLIILKENMRKANVDHSKKLLTVLLTKYDLVQNQFPEKLQGLVSNLFEIETRAKRCELDTQIQNISEECKNWLTVTANEPGRKNFFRKLRQDFPQSTLIPISSLGSETIDGRLPAQIQPKGVVAALRWQMHLAQSLQQENLNE